jgi:small subunit ribosomal protein S2
MNEVKVQQLDQEKIFEEMMKAGVHYGRAKRFTHPSMKNFLLKSNKNIEFFNLKLTLERLNQLSDFLKKALEENKKILFVGTTPASQQKIKEIAEVLNQFYINYKWVGGFLTNFQTIQARLLYFKELLKKEESGEIKNLPPHQRSKVEKELQKLKNLYSGVINLNSLPDIIFIVNLAYKQHKTAQREALKMKIPIVALAGSDNDVSNIFLFVPGNDKAPRSIAWQIDYLIRRLTQT